MTTIETALRGWVPHVNLDEGPPIPLSLVFQLPDKFTPTNVGDRFSKAVVFDHRLDLQALDTYDLVFAYDASRELVLVITASLAYSGVNASDFETSLVTVLAPLLFLRMSSLSLC